MDRQTVILAFITGAAVGMLFTVLKFPLPAPPALAGIMGIVGIYVGFLIVSERTTIVQRVQSLFS